MADIWQFPDFHPCVIVSDCVGDWLVGSVVGSIVGEWVALLITIRLEMKISAVHFSDIATER